MDTTILIFLGVALAILALALFLSRLFRREIARDKTIDALDNHDDLNARRRDGRATATWIGINRAGDGD